jgi:hypothetical protein
MIEGIIQLLIYVCVLALVVYLIIWVLGIIGVPIPDKVIQIVWVIVALVVILMVLRVVLPHLGVKLVGGKGDMIATLDANSNTMTRLHAHQ